jgi:membrane fusion protein, multidrug efflux system
MHSPVRLTNGDRETAWQLFSRLGRRLAVGASALVLAGAATWYGWNWRNVGRFIQWPDDTYVGGEVTTIASKVAGFIDKIVVTDNEFLKAGDLLIKLDDRDYLAIAVCRSRS